MNDRIAQMAREAGASFDPTFESVGDNPMWVMSPKDLARFARLVAEDCAKMAEWEPCETLTPQRIAQAIRDRYK